MAEPARYARLDPDAAGRRIGVLFDALSNDLEPTARRRVAELVQLVTAVHGAALERVLDVASQLDDGESIVAALGADPLIASLLAVHDLGVPAMPDTASPAPQPVRLIPRGQARR